MSHRPRQCQEITPAWLTQVLTESGAIQHTRVASVRMEAIGTFSSELWRVHIYYDRDEAGAPASLVLKRPKPNAQERPGMGFATEVTFYQQIAPRLTVRTPHYFWGYADRESGEAMLLMEDVAGLLPVTWKEGITTEHAQLALAALAHMHARWWERVDDLRGIPQLVDARFRAAMADAYERGWRASRDFFRATANKAFLELGEALVGRVEATLAPMGAPATLLHGDAHFENLVLFHERDVCGERRVLFHDWAAVRCGLASFDVAVFAVQSYPVARRRQSEEALVAAHADAVRAAGVTEWPDPWLDYRRGVLQWVIHMLQNATHQPGDPSWIVTERYMAAAVDLQVGELIV